MAIAFGGADRNTVPFSFTVGSTADRVLVVAFTANVQASSVTFGAAGLTIGVARTQGSSVYQIWYLLNPSASSANIAISGVTGSPETCAGWYSGVKNQAPTASNGNSVASGTSVANTLTPTDADSLHVGWSISQGGANISSISGATTRTVFASDTVLWDDFPIPASSNTVTTNRGSSSGALGCVGIAFSPQVAVGPAGVKTVDGVTQSTGVSTYVGASLATTKSVMGVT